MQAFGEKEFSRQLRAGGLRIAPLQQDHAVGPDADRYAFPQDADRSRRNAGQSVQRKKGVGLSGQASVRRER